LRRATALRFLYGEPTRGVQPPQCIGDDIDIMRRIVSAALGVLTAIAALRAPVVAAPRGGSTSFSVAVTSTCVANVSVLETARGISVVGSVERAANGRSIVGVVRLANLHRGEVLVIAPVAQGEPIADPSAAFGSDVAVVASAT
jgi:hypothetical protein